MEEDRETEREIPWLYKWIGGMDWGKGREGILLFYHGVHWGDSSKGMG